MLTVPRLRIAVIFFASGMASVMVWAQAPAAEGVQLGAAAQDLQQGKTDQTIRECKSVLAADPRSAPAHMLLALAYIAKASPAMVADAKAELQQALDIDPTLVWARFYLARLYVDQGLNDKAQEQLETGLKQSPGVPQLLSLLGEVRRKLGDPQASLELNRKALEADPTMTPVHYFLALAYLDLKQEQQAIGEFEKVVNTPYATPEMYNALAAVYLGEKRFADAEELCRKAITMNPAQPDAYLTLGRVYNARHLSDKALEVLADAIPKGRSFAVSEYYQGLQADLAVERGVAYADKKMYAQAIESYASALDFDPRRAVIHRRLAELYLRSGDSARAAQQTKVADAIEKGQE